MTFEQKLKSKIEREADKHRDGLLDSSGYEKMIAYHKLYAGANLLAPLLVEAYKALEFVSMPVTSSNPTVEGLLETIVVDTERAKEILNRLEQFTEE